MSRLLAWLPQISTDLSGQGRALASSPVTFDLTRRGHLTPRGNPAPARHRRRRQHDPPPSSRGLRDLTEHPGPAAVVALADPATEIQPRPQVPGQNVPVDPPAQGRPPKVLTGRSPRTLALWERLLIIAITSAFATVIVSFLFGIRLVGAHAHVVLAGPTWARGIPWRLAIYVAWLVPLGELGLMILGIVHYRLRSRRAPRGRFRLLLIQITTTGNEAVRVNEIITQIRGYDLRMPLQIWVVTEPWGAVITQAGYPGANR